MPRLQGLLQSFHCCREKVHLSLLVTARSHRTVTSVLRECTALQLLASQLFFKDITRGWVLANYVWGNLLLLPGQDAAWIRDPNIPFFQPQTLASFDPWPTSVQCSGNGLHDHTLWDSTMLTWIWCQPLTASRSGMLPSFVRLLLQLGQCRKLCSQLVTALSTRYGLSITLNAQRSASEVNVGRKKLRSLQWILLNS